MNLLDHNHVYPMGFTSSWLLNSPKLRNWGAIRIQLAGGSSQYGSNEELAITMLNTDFTLLYYSNPEKCESALCLESSNPLAAHNILAVREWVDSLMGYYDDPREIYAVDDAAYEISKEHMQPTQVPYPYIIESLEPDQIPPGVLYWHDLDKPVHPLVSLNPGMDNQIESELGRHRIKSHRVNQSFALRLEHEWMWEKTARQFYMIVRDQDQIRYRRTLFVPDALYRSLYSARLDLLSGTDLRLKGVD